MLRRVLTTAIAAGALAGVLAPAAGAVVLPQGFVTSTELTGVTRPTKIAWAPDGRRFLIEKDGVLKVAAPGATAAQTVLDLRSEVNSFQDRGLLGLAVDSDFATNGFLYLLFTYDVNRATTTPGPDAANATAAQLRRITIGANNQVLASQVILGSRVTGPCPTPSNSTDCIPSDGTSHSIGTVISAPDGTLFVGVGDAADYNVADPLSLRTYNEQSMAGKILHVDRNGRGLSPHPFCATNTNLDHVCTKLYAKGFRNPFRFQLLPSGALFVGDVGWSWYEEIDLVTAGGKSYGWPCYEGPDRTPTWRDKPECAAEYAKEGTANAHVGPIHYYQHNYDLHLSWAVVVGPEYTGNSYPAGYRGSIFAGDYGAGFLRRMTLNPAGQVASITDFATGWGSVDLTSAPNGDIAWVDLGGWGDQAGFVDRLVYSPGNAKPNAVARATPSSGTAPLAVSFDGSGSTDADNDQLQYDWDFGDGTAHGQVAMPSHTYAGPGTYTATLTVADGRGQSDTDSVQINASNTPPVPSIDAPPAGFKYRDGAQLTVTGTATDTEEGALPASAFRWNVVLVHKDHQHQLMNPSSVRQFDMTPVRDHDADSYYVIRLTVTDAGGASASTEREIRPETAPLHLRSVPTGAPLSYAGTAVTAPWDTDSAVGFTGTISAAQSFVSGRVERQFLSWSSGAARVHDFTVPATETTLTATYNAVPVAHAVAAAGSVNVGEELLFDASASSDADNHELTYQWDFGDGSAPSSAVSPGHPYPAAGDFDATLTVTDELGASATDSVPVTVTPAPAGEDPPPSDGNTTPSDSSGGFDVTGPLLRPWRPHRRPRLLAGLATDPAGVDAVTLAVAKVRDGRCRWLTGSPAHLARHGVACSERQWLSAALAGRRWALTLPPRLPAGSYRVWFLALDRLGNRRTHTIDGQQRLSFTVKKLAVPAASCSGPLLRRPLGCSRLAPR